jgi:predicted outer membrane repeat protein
MVVRNNLFKNNVSNLNAGALCFESNDPNSYQVLVENNYFLGNSAYSGGAFVGFNVPVVFQNNIFMGNNANTGGGAIEIYTSAEQAVLINNVFSDNQASIGGGAIYIQGTSLQQNHLAILINNSFTGNSAVNFGGALYTNKAMPLVFNTNFYGNEAAIGQEIYLNHYLDTLDLAYSNVDPGKIYGNVSYLEGNINEDPGFLDDTCHIDQYSPSEDHGIDSIYIDGTWYYAPISDFEGSPRPYHMGIDIGADECDIIENMPDPGIHINNLVQVQSYPNPFTNFTTFDYEVEQSAKVNLSIYNYLGQKVAVLVDGEQEAGRHQVRWEAGGMPAGIYFFRLTVSGQRSVIGKLVKK